MKFYVEIIDCITLEAVERIECKSEREAQRVQDEVNINLNHERYFTRIAKGEGESE